MNTVFDRIYAPGAYAKKLPFAPCDINMDGPPVLLLAVCSNLEPILPELP